MNSILKLFSSLISKPIAKQSRMVLLHPDACSVCGEIDSNLIAVNPHRGHPPLFVCEKCDFDLFYTIYLWRNHRAKIAHLLDFAEIDFYKSYEDYQKE